MKPPSRSPNELGLSKSGITRRNFVKILAITGTATSLSPKIFAKTSQSPIKLAGNITESYVYVGTYSNPNFAPGAKNVSTAKGIYVFKMDKLGHLSLIQEMPSDNPSFLTLDPSNQYLYCVNELGADGMGAPLGRVSAYKINPSDGTISFINTELTNGTWPCHLIVHPSGKYLLAANYGSGNFPAYPILENGGIGKMTDMYQSLGNGEGPDGSRQSGSHAHMILTNPGAQHVFGIDLSADKIVSLELDLSSGKFTPGIVPNANLTSGAGPRHMVFHPSDKFAYILNELSSTIDIFDFNPIRGSLTWIQNISTLPLDTNFVRPMFDPTNPGKVPEGTNTTAEIRIHPTGKWLYATNRGMNSIVTYKVEENTGKLTAIDWVSSQGEIPRGMNIDPSGNLLFVGNQNTDSIIVFNIGFSDGKPQGPLHMIDSTVPVDFAFSPII